MKILFAPLQRLCCRTLRRQIIVGVVLVQALMMSLFIWDLTRHHARLLLDRQVEQVIALARALAVSTAGCLAPDDSAGLQEIITRQTRYPELVFAMLVDHQGRVLAHTDPARIGSHLQGLPDVAWPTVLSSSEALIDVVCPVDLAGRHEGWARIGVSQRPTRERLAEITISNLLYWLAAILAASLLAWFMGRRLTGRLDALQQTVDAVRSGDCQARADLAGTDEVAVLAREFNQMLDSLAESNAERQHLHRRNRMILDAAGEGIYGVDTAGRILFANPATCAMLGYSQEELLGADSHELFHHSRADGTPYPPAECPLRRSLAEGTVCRGHDEVFWNREGRMFPVEHVNTPLFEEGRVIGAVVVFSDITARKLSEDALRLSTGMLAEAQRIAHLGHWSLDLVRNHLVWSDEVYRIFGLAPDEFAATYEAFLAMVHPEDREMVDRAYRDSVKNLGSYDVEHRIVLKSGEIRYVNERGVTKYDESGRPVHSLGTVLDISERKHSQDKLCLANTVVENSSTILFRWRAAEGWPVEYVSENVVQFGYAAADLMSGKIPYSALVYPDDLARVAEEVVRYSASGVERFDQEYRIITVAGEVRSVEDNTTVERDASGRITHYQGIVNDITERKRLEAQLRQAQKMEAIGTLAGGIAHDFNNILTAIIGYGEIVMERLAEEDSPLREDQAQVLKAAERARDLVRQILTFSRRSEQQLQPMLVQFVLKEALKLLRASIPTSIEIRESIDVNCGAVMADPVQIHQVIMNLCTNAYQAMREQGGILTVSLREVMVAPADMVSLGILAGPQVLLEVGDTGCGMTREVRERIFEPYFTTKGKGEGTGLGLSLVHGIVTALGGRIGVYSEPGQGSTFKVYLPQIRENEGLVVAPAPGTPPPGGRESVLVLDDEESIALLERRLLQGLGYRVTACVDSGEALRLFSAEPAAFDLVLTDMTMPQMTGAELAREILRIRPGTPIVLCTGFSELIDGEKAREIGIRVFLHKPITRDDLARAVREALDGNRDAAPATAR